MGTIVQDYGPIYGEVVNGTVQGRPNGSVYVPLSNTIALTGSPTTIVWNGVDALLVDVAITLDAKFQDLASYMSIQVYSDSALTTQVGSSLLFPYGLFNNTRRGVAAATSNVITTNDDYYIVARLLNNGTPVAVSNTIHVVGA